MISTTIKKQALRDTAIILGQNREEVEKTLKETAGIWRGRKIDPVRYQRAMRKSYSLERMN